MNRIIESILSKIESKKMVVYMCTWNKASILTCFLKFSIIMVLYSNTTNAQNRLFNVMLYKNTSSTIESLKKSTTLFTLQYNDYSEKEIYENAIRSVWTATPFQIIRPEEVDSYSLRQGYSIFSFNGVIETMSSGFLYMASHFEVYYDLSLNMADKKKKIKQQLISRILIYPDRVFPESDLGDLTPPPFAKDKKEKAKVLMNNILYNKGNQYFNWGPGFLKGYLKLVNEGILAGNPRGAITMEDDRKALAELKTDTLYVPRYVGIDYGIFNTPTSYTNEISIDTAQYPYPIRFLSSKELNSLIMDGKRSVKYLLYAKSAATSRCVDIFDSKDNKLIYARFYDDLLSHTFKMKDLAAIAKSIR